MTTLLFIVGLYFLCRALGRAGQRRRSERQAAAIREAQMQRARELQAYRDAEKRRQAEARAQAQRQIAADRERIRRQQAMEAAKRKAAQEAEKRRKEAFLRQQAQAELDSFDTIRDRYMQLYDMLEAELKDAKTTSKRRLAVQRQLCTLDEKLYKLDAKRSKAYFVAVEGRAY